MAMAEFDLVGSQPKDIFCDLKARANKLSQQCNWVEAEDLYTTILEAYEGLHPPAEICKIFCNRSLVRFKLENYEESKNDAQRSIDLEPEWHKGWARKALALEACLQTDEALSAIRVAISLDGSIRDYHAIAKRLVVTDVQDMESGVTEHPDSPAGEAGHTPEENLNGWLADVTSQLGHSDEEWSISTTLLPGIDDNCIVQIANDTTGDVKSWVTFPSRIPSHEQVVRAVGEAMVTQSGQTSSAKVIPVRVTLAARLGGIFEEVKGMLSDLGIEVSLEERRNYDNSTDHSG